MKIPNYPKKDGDRLRYVRYPVQVNEAYNAKSPLQIPLDKWVAVDVLQEGYRPLLSPNPFESFEKCKKACDVSNRVVGFTEEECINVVAQSMANSLSGENEVLEYIP